MKSNTTVTLNRSSFDRHFHGGPAVQIYAVNVRVHENDWPQVDTVIRCRADEFADRLAEFVAAHSVLAAAAKAIEITPQDELSATVAAYDPRWGLSTVADCSFRVELASTVERAAEQAARSAAAAALGRMGGASTSPAKRAASRANGAKGGRPATSVEDCYCTARRGVVHARGYYAGGRFFVSSREAARLCRVWGFANPDDIVELWVYGDGGVRVPVRTR